MTISNFSVSDWGISYTYSSYLSFSEIDLNKLAVRLITNDLAELIVESNQIEPYRVCRRVNILRDYPDDKIKIYP